MENSERIFFDKNDASQWYVAVGTKWIGPMTAADILERVRLNQLSWAHYVWKKGQAGWQRICDTQAFLPAAPHAPTHSVKEIPAASTKPQTRSTATSRKNSAVELQETKTWYLHYDESQFGPFTQGEVQQLLNTGRIDLRTHIWREGMKNWERLEAIPVLQAPPQSSTKVTKKVDNRNAPRRPLVAKILMSDEQTVIVGVCRDISIGGLQVLTEKIPGPVGARIKMNISPSTNESGASVAAFVAKGIIVRVLEDGRGFSFRFENLTPKARESIESFIKSAR